MRLELAPLPYEKDALAPFIGVRTVHLHYRGHHQDFVRKLETAIGSGSEAQKSLEELVRGGRGAASDFAAQVWNHDFYWRSMTPRGGGAPSGALLERVERDFGGVAELKRRFAQVARREFGSGWVWLVLRDGRLAVESRHDADTPLRHGATPLLACDLWEHAYYLDYRNEREKYVEVFLDHLVHWDFAAQRLARAERREPRGGVRSRLPRRAPTRRRPAEPGVEPY